jgi:hypothetical protein
MKTLRTLLVLAATLPAVAQAQRATPLFGAKGLFLGAALNGSSVKIDEFSEDGDDDTESGGGLSIFGGWGFTPQLALFIEGSAASLDTEGDSWTLSHGDLGLRYHFTGATRKFVPFVQGAFTARMASIDDIEFEGDDDVDIEITGTGLTLGGGFLYFFNRNLGLSTDLKWTTGEFDKVKVGSVSVEDLDIDATSSRLNLGLTWFPGRR